jgi:purine-binding chemotaxis protein CheW
MNAISSTHATRRECLTFSLGAEDYGVDILHVQEIRSGDAVARLPDLPEHLLGVINLRGTIVPVVDLRIKLGLPRDAAAATATIVLDVDDRKVAIVVDRVSDVVRFEAAAIRPVPALTVPASGSPLLGLGTIDERMVILLDAAVAFDAEPVALSALAA